MIRTEERRKTRVMTKGTAHTMYRTEEIREALSEYEKAKGDK